MKTSGGWHGPPGRGLLREAVLVSAADDLAIGVIGRPEVLFIDEPTTAFDPEARRRTWAAIENLAATGTTTVLTTHYIDEAEHLAERIRVPSQTPPSLAGMPSVTTPAACRLALLKPIRCRPRMMAILLLQECPLIVMVTVGRLPPPRPSTTSRGTSSPLMGSGGSTRA